MKLSGGRGEWMGRAAARRGSRAWWIAGLLLVWVAAGCTGEIERSDDSSLEQAARRLPATLTADPAVAIAGGAPYTLSGAGFAAGLEVTIKASDPTRGSVYTTVAASDGTVQIALTTNGAGLYRFNAYQQSGKRNVLMARASLAVTPPESCGDALCNGAETCAACPADCGACPAACGNDACESGETCSSCPADCGACPPACGDGACNGTETCSACPADCGACAPACGDGACNGTETCSSCAGDCGACAPRCGDGTCNGTETCSSCPTDCGVCPPACGDGTCNGSETCTSCAADCGACTSCIPAATTLPDGRHNAGTDCMGCHQGGSAPAWTVAGTLYAGASSSTAVAGATIRVTDKNGKVVNLVTASNGNFYTQQSVVFPLKVEASKCPDSAPMSSQASSGACNSCHGSGFRVHLP